MPLFLGMIALMVSVSTINMVICRNIVLKGSIEVGYVRDSYSRVGLTAQSRSLVRTMLNVANGVESRTSFMSEDRFALAKSKLNDTSEHLRILQNRLIKAEFKFSQEFKEYLNSLIVKSHLGRGGSRFVNHLSHHSAVNAFVGYVVEFLRMEPEQIKGSLNILSLQPEESNAPSAEE